MGSVLELETEREKEGRKNDSLGRIGDSTSSVVVERSITCSRVGGSGRKEEARPSASPRARGEENGTTRLTQIESRKSPECIQIRCLKTKVVRLSLRRTKKTNLLD